MVLSRLRAAMGRLALRSVISAALGFGLLLAPLVVSVADAETDPGAAVQPEAGADLDVTLKPEAGAEPGAVAGPKAETAPLVAVQPETEASAQGAKPARLSPQEAKALTDTVFTAIQGDQVLMILAREGADYGNALPDVIFDAKQAPGWQATVAGIYAQAGLKTAFLTALGKAVADHPDLDRQALVFLQSDLGQRILTLELAARTTLGDADAKEAAEVEADKLRQARVPRMRHYDRLITKADFIESSVASGLSSLIAFHEGLAESTPASAGPSLSAQDARAQVRAQVWAQEPDIRRDATAWLQTYMVLAYATLSDAELARYIDYHSSDAGKALTSALQSAFEAALQPSMRALGREAGRVLQGRQI